MPGSLRPDVDRAGAPTFGKSGAGLGDITRRRSLLGLVRPDRDRQARRSYAAAVNEMSAAEPGPISRLEARRSARPYHRYKVTPKRCPTPRRQIVGGNVVWLCPIHPRDVPSAGTPLGISTPMANSWHKTSSPARASPSRDRESRVRIQSPPAGGQALQPASGAGIGSDRRQR